MRVGKVVEAMNNVLFTLLLFHCMISKNGRLAKKHSFVKTRYKTYFSEFTKL